MCYILNVNFFSYKRSFIYPDAVDRGWEARGGSKKCALYAGLGSRSRSEPDDFGSLEPEPLEKKPGARAAWKESGAGVTKKLAGSSALREDKKHKEIVLLVTILYVKK